MKRNQFLVWVTLIALGLSGCAHFVCKPAAPPQYRPRAFALAVTVHRVLQPTPQQWAAVQASMADAIKAHGWVLVTDLALADHILRVEFTPSLNDPENSGVAEVVGIRPNPRLAIAGTSSIGRYPTSFSYAGPFQYASWGHGGFSNSHFFGWGSAFDQCYSYGSANLSPGRAHRAEQFESASGSFYLRSRCLNNART